MSLSLLDTSNYYIEKARIPLSLVGGIAAFIKILFNFYYLAYFIVTYELSLNFYDYMPIINLRPFTKILIFLIYLPLILNTSAVRSKSKRIAALILWFLIFVLAFIIYSISLDFIPVIIIQSFRYIFEIAFFIITFKARPVLNFILLLIRGLNIILLVFRILVMYSDISTLIPFSITYIYSAESFIVFFWWSLYLFSNTGRSNVVKSNMQEWTQNQNLSTATTTMSTTTGSVHSDSIAQNTNSTVMTKNLGNNAGLDSGGTFGIPRALFYCTTCKSQKKIRLQKNDIYQENKCPSCGNILLAWWAQSPKSKYLKFIIGVMFMGGGLFSIMIEGILNEGLIPVIIMNTLGIIYLIISLILMYTASKLDIQGPHPTAAKVLPHGVFERFGSELIKITVIATIGGLFLFGFNRIIVFIAVL
ncbi:MAG: hypothetical protein K9W44_14295 [Candidatus Lokiarchaeota archaeon]|nr:hypothetical protein [Candidatus Harpocratesius repetitus]